MAKSSVPIRLCSFINIALFIYLQQYLLFSRSFASYEYKLLCPGSSGRKSGGSLRHQTALCERGPLQQLMAFHSPHAPLR